MGFVSRYLYETQSGYDTNVVGTIPDPSVSGSVAVTGGTLRVTPRLNSHPRGESLGIEFSKE